MTRRELRESPLRARLFARAARTLERDQPAGDPAPSVAMTGRLFEPATSSSAVSTPSSPPATPADPGEPPAKRPGRGGRRRERSLGDELLERVLAGVLAGFDDRALEDIALFDAMAVAALVGRSLRSVRDDIAAGRLRVTHDLGYRSRRFSFAEVRRYVASFAVPEVVSGPLDRSLSDRARG